MDAWISFTLLAVIMQSVRTAGQKQIATKISPQAATLVRYLFGLPFALIYFYWLQADYPITKSLNLTFFVSASLAAVSQIAATVLLIKALTLKNFAVGTALAKTEAILTAVIGSLFFSAVLNLAGYLSVFLGVAGVLIASNWRVSWADLTTNKSIKLGVGAGLGFAFASLWIRDASLSLAIDGVVSAATVLVFMVTLQTVLCLLWVVIFEHPQIALIAKNIPASLFIGITSVLGSIGWFTAMSLQNAALVKTLGQTEFLVTIAITTFYFSEKISKRELAGIALIALSVLVLLGAS
ncbi:MAG: drug/metabolite transporter (DMT)-like permease [Pseudohongiellaceae bacterium]|jgi:drug/metabolite transporter (DMT)-like permease